MTGTRLAHYLWVRWDSGAADCFAISRDSHDRISVTNKTEITDPTGNQLFLNFDKVSAYKLITKTHQSNPLNDESHYDDPLN